MALAVAQSVHVTGLSAPPTTATLSSSSTVGNLIIVCVNSYNGTVAAGNVTDSKGNTYALDFQYTLVSSSTTQTYFSAQVVTGGASHTVTFTNAGVGVVNLDIIEVSGAATSSPFDKSASNSGTGGPYTTGTTGTLAQSDEIVFVSVGVDSIDNKQLTEDATYTLIGEFLDGNLGYINNSAYKIVAATTAINHTWTTTFGSEPWFATAATYKGPSGPATLVVADAAHAHTADNLTLNVPGVFAVQDAAHAHTADQVAFPPQAVGADGSHAHTADNVGITLPAVVSDNFNRADNTSTLGTGWTHDTGSWQISSNRAWRYGFGSDFAVFNTDIGSTDMYVQAEVLSYPTGPYQLVNGRTSPALRGVQQYACFVNPVGPVPPGTLTITMSKTVGGVYSQIGSTATIFVASAPVVLRMELEGSTQRVLVNGVLAMTTNDTSITTGTYAGLNASGGTTNPNYFDNFSCGSLAVPPVTLTVANALHAHTADAPTLSVGFLVNSAAHAHTADNILLPATLVVANAAHAHTATSPAVGPFLYPVRVSNRKLIDQAGGVFVMNDISSWAMADNLTNAEITQALTGIAARHFSAIQIGMFIEQTHGTGSGWHRYTNAAGQPFFATVAGGSTPGVPFRDPLGAAWSSMDWVMTEATRLGLTVMYAYFGGYSTANGIVGDMNVRTVAEAYTYGQRIFDRYASYDNLVWALEWEGMWSPSSAEGQRADAFFHAIQDRYVSTGRPYPPLIFYEPNSDNPDAGALIGTGWNWAIMSAACMYSYASNSVERVDGAYTQSGLTTYPLWDSEPGYIGATQYNPGVGAYAPLTDQTSRQNWRERNYSILIRGGVGINFGDEAWWTFGSPGIFFPPWTWQDVPTNVTSYEAQYCWDLLITPEIVKDPTWVPDNSFLLNGLGSGDTKAAAGRGAHSAVVYFPNNSRTVTVDTSKVGPLASSYLTPSVSVATTPDLPLTTDFTILAKFRKPASFAAAQTLASQATSATSGIAWSFRFSGGGAMWFDYSTSGTTINGGFGTISSSLWSGIATGTPIYVAFSYDNQGANYTIGGWWSLDGVTWNGPLGGGTASGPPTFFDSSAPIRIGAYSATNADPFSSGIDWVEMRNGTTPTTGTVGWRFDAVDWVSGTTWTDARGHTWTIGSSGAITDVPATNVRLRWYDPVLASFTSIAGSEAPSTSRSVSFPSGTHSDNNTDWVLVIDDRGDLGVNNGTHAHFADNAAITVAFTVNDALHTHAASTVTLSTGLVVQDALHAHTADQAPITTGLAVNNAAHAHTADGLIVLGAGLTVADALHGHRADNVDVAQPGVVNSAFHAHIATHITLTVVAISKIRLGAVTPQAMKVGTAPVARVYLGNAQVF